MARNRKTTPTQDFIRVFRELGGTIYAHREWGSRSRPTYALRRRFKPHHAFPSDTMVHHITVTRDTGSNVRSFKSDARIVEGIGVSRFATGMSYNTLTDMRTGQVCMGQPFDAKGAHTLNDKKVAGFSFDQNYVAFAMASLGMVGDKLSDEAVLSHARQIAALRLLGTLTPGHDYLPHSFFAFKDCPTDAVRNRMKEILEKSDEIYDKHKRHKKHMAK